MGGVVKAIVGVAVAVVGVVTGNPLLIAQGAMMTLGAVMGKPNAGNKATNGRLSKRLEPEDFRKIVFGKTAAGADLRYWETWGSDYTKFDEVVAVATHTIHSFQETYIEEELVGLSGGAATGTYAGALSVLQTTTGGHLSAGAGSLWNASMKMTGIPHYVFRWTYSEKKLPQGIPSRYTRIIEGALVYDPRRDSTRGGSGSHRADDQSTWEYAPTDSNGKPIGRNNALQMLWYLIGWRINGKLVAGRGVDLSDIDFAGFIAAANDAETQEYYTDMILSTGDNHTTNEGIISADGLLGELLDAGGLWTYHVTRNDVAEVAVALDDDDVVEGGAVSWAPFKPMSEKFNEVAGTFIDPSPTSLFQSRAYPTVSDAAYYAADNYKKRKMQVYQCVQDVVLAQKLSRIMLNRNRYQGEFTATFNLRALRARVWDIVWLSLERFGFEDKPFRVIRQSVSAQGVEMVLREEEASIYTGGTVIEQAPPSAGSKYDPRMQVLVTGMNLATGYISANDGSTQDALIVTWNPAPGNVRRTEVQYKLSSETDENKWQSVNLTTSDAASAAIAPVVPQTQYDVRVRHVTVNEVPGPYTTMTVIAGDSTRSVANRVTYLDNNDLESWKPFEPYADVTANALDYAGFYLASREDRLRTETRTRFDPIFWTTNFPSTMMASVRKTAANAVKMDAVFFERGHLAGLIWESVDAVDHPTTAYDTKKDYRNTVLNFDYALTGDVKAIDEVEGMVLTIEGRDAGGSPKTYYLQLYFCRTSGTGTNGHCTLDFSDLPDEVGGGSIYAGDVDRMFISLVPSNYELNNTTKLTTPITASIELTNITVTGTNKDLICGLGPGGAHSVRMTNGYDDTYNVVPDRIVRNCQLLGYKGEFNHYVGMSHYFQWLWNAGENRYIAQDVTNPLNTPCKLWHEALASALAAADMTLIISLSYELLNSFAPTSWRQLDSAGNPALTGWAPPSTLLSPCNTTAMGYLIKVARQFCDIADAAGLDVHFQVGEPWYWINFNAPRTPFFYDTPTTSLYTAQTGLTAPVITDMAAAMSPAQIAYLDWLGEKLAESILDIIDAVRGDHPLMTSYALLYLPQLLEEATPEAHRVNMPPALAYPALDILQVEDYDFVIANDQEKSAVGRGRIEDTLGYPRSRQHYFSGFALYKETAANIWRYSTVAMRNAFQWGVYPVFIWAYTQVMRDGYVPLLRSAPALHMKDLKDVELDLVPATNGQVLRYDSATKQWKPATLTTGDVSGAVTTFLGLTDTPSSYSGHAFKVPRVNSGGTALEFAPILQLPAGGAAGTILQKFGAGDGEATWSALTAGIVAFSPAGGLSSTNVQSALVELDTEKASLSGGIFSGHISVPDDAYAAGWNGSTQVATKNAIYDKIESLTFLNLSDVPDSYTGHGLKFPRIKSDGSGLEFVAVSQLPAGGAAGTILQKFGAGDGEATWSALTAGITAFTPTGGIAATNVQSALAELDSEKAALAGAAFTGNITVPNDAYASGWNGSQQVPTKDAIYDKLESMVVDNADSAQIPTLNSPWINYGGGFGGARYFKDHSGLVTIEGLIQAPGGSSTSGVVLFTLLSGYRPPDTIMFVTWSGGGACRIDIQSNGDVVMQSGNTAFTSLAGIKFYAAV